MTGTNIRGVGISVGSAVTVIGRDAIDRAGFATTQDIIQSLPQNFRGGISEDAVSLENDANRSGGTAANLRGLGAGATLTLINNRRVAQAGNQAGFTDISSIPSSAIERIEVLTDGASAVYGSDAIAGVVNVILRDDYEGAETRLRFGTVTQRAGSRNTRSARVSAPPGARAMSLRPTNITAVTASAARTGTSPPAEISVHSVATISGSIPAYRATSPISSKPSPFPPVRMART